MGVLPAALYCGFVRWFGRLTRCIACKNGLALAGWRSPSRNLCAQRPLAVSYLVLIFHTVVLTKCSYWLLLSGVAIDTTADFSKEVIASRRLTPRLQMSACMSSATPATGSDRIRAQCRLLGRTDIQSR